MRSIVFDVLTALIAVTVVGGAVSMHAIPTGSTVTPPPMKLQTTAAGDTTIIPDAVTCPKCEIRLDTTLVVTDREGHLGSAGHGVRLPTGDYLIATLPETGELLLYDSRGKFQRKIGRPGDGPGEYRNVSKIIVALSRMYVMDSRQGRITVLDSTFRYVEDFRLPLAPTDLVISGQSIIANGLIPSRDRVGFHLHRLTLNGGVEESFGELFGSNSTLHGSQRHLAASSDGTFFTLSPSDYVVQHWTSAGDLLGTWRRSVEYLVERSVTDDPAAPPRPSAAMWRIQGASEHHVWVIARVPDPDWRRSMVFEPREGLVEPAWWIDDRQQYYDSIVELLDLRLGRVIARRRFDEHFHKFADPDHLIAFDADDAGVPVFRVWRLRLSVE